MVPRPACYDDVLTAYDEMALRWAAWRHALANASTTPDEEMFFAVLELEMATDGWRQRFVAALARIGMTVDDALGGPVA